MGGTDERGWGEEEGDRGERNYLIGNVGDEPWGGKRWTWRGKKV